MEGLVLSGCTERSPVAEAAATALTNRNETWTLAKLSAPSSNHVSRYQNGVLLPRQQWNLKTTVGAYWQVGQRDPRWDAAAIEALEGFALSRGGELDEPGMALHRSAFEASARAQKAGCKDPLVHYIGLRCQREAKNFTQSDFAAIDYEMRTRAIAAAKYPPGRVHLCLMTVVERWKAMRVTPTNLPALLTEAGTTLQATLADPDLPEELAILFSEAYVNTVSDSKQDVHAAWLGLRQGLRARWAGTYVEDVIQGNAYLRWAWAARGTRWASQVTEEGWKLMGERLEISEECLNRAWKKNPKDWLGPTVMMETAFMNGCDHDAMEVWFQRAMLNNTNNRAACARKLHFLAPKWGGSVEQLVEFGRHCFTNTAWSPKVAEMLPNAHSAVVFDIPDVDERNAYYRQPEVWADIKAAYQKLIRAYPLVRSFRDELKHWGVLSGHAQEAQDLAQN